MSAPTIAGAGAQHNSGFTTATTTISVSLPANATAGNMLLVWVGCGGAGTATINTPTMTGETFTNVAGASNTSGSNVGQHKLFVVNSCAGGQKQVTATTSVSEDIHLHVMEVTGQGASPQDATGNTRSTTLSVSTSGSTTTATDLVIAFFYDNDHNQTVTAGTGYAQIEQSNNTTGGDVGFSESKTVSATGVQTATITDGGTGDTYLQGIIAVAGTSAATNVPGWPSPTAGPSSRL